MKCELCYQWWMLAVIFMLVRLIVVVLLFHCEWDVGKLPTRLHLRNQPRKCDFMLYCIEQMKKNCKEASFAKNFFCCLCMQLEREKSNTVITSLERSQLSFLFASKRVVIPTSSSSHDKFINVKHQILNNLIC